MAELGELHAQLGLDPDAADHRIKLYRYTVAAARGCPIISATCQGLWHKTGRE